MGENQKKALIIVVAVLAVVLAGFIGYRTLGDPPLQTGNVIPNKGPKLSDLEKRGMPQFQNQGGTAAPAAGGGEPDLGGAIGNRGGN